LAPSAAVVPDRAAVAGDCFGRVRADYADCVARCCGRDRVAGDSGRKDAAAGFADCIAALAEDIAAAAGSLDLRTEQPQGERQ
jgi:hypothetical protein